MKKITLLFSAMCITLFGIAGAPMPSDTIAYQGFNLVGDTWGYASSPADFNVSGDVWDVVSEEWMVQDLNNTNGGTTGYGTLVFQSVDVSAYTDVVLSFDSRIEGYDGTDVVKYQVFEDDAGQGEVLLTDGSSGFTADSTVLVDVTPGVDAVYVVLSVKQDGGSDYAYFDNFTLVGFVDPSIVKPTIEDLIPADGTMVEVDSMNVLRATVKTTDALGIDTVMVLFGLSPTELTDTFGTDHEADTFMTMYFTDSVCSYYGRVVAIGGNGEKSMSDIVEIVSVNHYKPIFGKTYPSVDTVTYFGDSVLLGAIINVDSGMIEEAYLVFSFNGVDVFNGAPLEPRGGDMYAIEGPAEHPDTIYIAFMAMANGEMTISDYVAWSNTCGTYDAPVAAAATSIASMGFNANWNALEDDHNYLLSVWADVLTTTASELFISAYVEGSGDNKYLALYNGTGSTVDLSAYTLQVYINGAPIPSNVNVLSGNLAHGATIVYANSAATAYSGATTTLSTCNFNGDDVPVLLKGAVIIDAAGPLGNANNNNYAINKSLYREASTFMPTPAFDMADWDEHPQDYVTDLGTHTMIPGLMQVYVMQDSLVGDVLSFAVSDLLPEVDYTYSVKAENIYSCLSDTSNHIEVSTLASIPTAVVSAVDMAVKVYATAGGITVKAEGLSSVSVYDITGRQVTKQMVNGETHIAVKSGIYLVKVGEHIVRVAVN